MALARELIDADADKVVRRLARRGHKAYLVGGCVRDLLLERKPKDFDVATSATPNEIKQTFRNCRIIGRRFRLAHIFFGGKIIETSTFRANPRREAGESGELLIRHDNVFGSVTDDAHRRDFTINGLFYDVQTEEVIDHVGGLEDLETRLVRTIGDPNIRFQEDPVRMLRAIKFAARLSFDIEAETFAALTRHRHEILKCAPPRVLEEFYRFFRGGAARRSLELLIETGVASVLTPHLATLFAAHEGTEEVVPEQPAADVDEEEASWAATWAEEPAPLVTTHSAPLQLSFIDQTTLAERRAVAWKIIGALDERIRSGAELSNALVLATVVNAFVFDSLLQPGVRPLEASGMILEVLGPLVTQLRVARRDAERARQLLLAQRRLAPSRRRRGKPQALAQRDYFDEALTVYELTAQAADREAPEIERWQALKSPEHRDTRESPDDDSRTKRRRRRRGGRRRRRSRDDTTDASDGALDEAAAS